MNIKKLLSLFLSVSIMILFTAPLSAESSNEDESLYNFLKTTENITTSYKYPSMKLATSVNGKSRLSAHTPIMIRCEETISTKDVVSGGTVNFSVLSDVKDENGLIVIRAGAPVTAQITFAKKNGMIGKSGQITVSDFHTIAVDGTYVPLSASISAQPDDNMTTSVVLSVLICPLFLLMKGDEAQVPAGTTKTAYTVSDVYIKAVKS